MQIHSLPGAAIRFAVGLEPYPQRELNALPPERLNLLQNAFWGRSKRNLR